MIAVEQNEARYLAIYSEVEKVLAGSGQAWLARIRREAIESFGELGFPTTRNEEWKYTSVAPIAGTGFEPARYELTPQVVEAIKGSPLADLGCVRLTFVNGHYAGELSDLRQLPADLKALSLAAALETGEAKVEEHLARYADYKQHPFVALNTAFMQDGTSLVIPGGKVLERPICFLYVSTAGSRPAISHPRNLVLVGRESQVSIIEVHLGLEDGTYFTNAVTEVVAEEGAIVEYHKIQQEGPRAFHIGTLAFQQDRSSSIAVHTVSLGAALDREDTGAVLAGEGAECHLNGLYILSGEQHADHHTVIDHAQPHCSSRELYKGVLDGKSRGVFNGKIIVRKDAQKTDSKQTNKNLLLSEDATVDTKPQLEIYADDVKCTHGATIGQVDPETIFYLRSRGIGKNEARNLLTYAFANDVIGKIRYEPLRTRLGDALFAQLAQGQEAEGK
jgi:Fe-S cluster assembly protein SufD